MREILREKREIHRLNYHSEIESEHDRRWAGEGQE